MSPFQIVRFVNGPCNGGTKNGTCFTSAECSAVGGTNAGSCANGFGVCCTSERVKFPWVFHRSSFVLFSSIYSHHRLRRHFNAELHLLRQQRGRGGVVLSADMPVREQHLPGSETTPQFPIQVKLLIPKKIRLDFTSFTIAGPSTLTNSVTNTKNGVVSATATAGVTQVRTKMNIQSL